MNIDIHNHILWGIDDGPTQQEETVQMAKVAAHEGITHILATPHHNNGKHNNPPSLVLERVELANEMLRSENIPLIILPGSEIHLYGNLLEDVKNHQVLTLNQSGKYVLVELPCNHVPRFTDQVFFELAVHGYTPVIAHAERNSEFLKDPNRLVTLVKNGALVQVTASSILGKSNISVSRFARKLLKNNLVHFVASDAHNAKRRTFVLGKAYKWIQRHYGAQHVVMFKNNATRLMKGEEIVIPPPIPFEKRKFFFLMPTKT